MGCSHRARRAATRCCMGNQHGSSHWMQHAAPASHVAPCSHAHPAHGGGGMVTHGGGGMPPPRPPCTIPQGPIPCHTAGRCSPHLSHSTSSCMFHPTTHMLHTTPQGCSLCHVAATGRHSLHDALRPHTQIACPRLIPQPPCHAWGCSLNYALQPCTTPSTSQHGMPPHTMPPPYVPCATPWGCSLCQTGTACSCSSCTALWLHTKATSQGHCLYHVATASKHSPHPCTAATFCSMPHTLRKYAPCLLHRTTWRCHAPCPQCHTLGPIPVPCRHSLWSFPMLWPHAMTPHAQSSGEVREAGLDQEWQGECIMTQNSGRMGVGGGNQDRSWSGSSGTGSGAEPRVAAGGEVGLDPHS